MVLSRQLLGRRTRRGIESRRVSAFCFDAPGKKAKRQKGKSAASRLGDSMSGGGPASPKYLVCPRLLKKRYHTDGFPEITIGSPVIIIRRKPRTRTSRS